MDDCLSEDVAAALVDGSLDEEGFSRAERHISECEACLQLVAEVGSALASHDDERPLASEGEAPELVRGMLVGRYEILELLGAGGMGRVYGALDPALDRKVALKLLHPRTATADLEARLLREAKSMARLSHPEVITIHDVGRHGAQLFIAMEWVDGGTLRQWLAEAPRTWREILGVYLRAGRGLARAHAAGIIHRDFKPDNVLIGSDGRVRVTDFGLARAAQSADLDTLTPVTDAGTVDVTLTRTGALLGTPAYMAPEQSSGMPADVRSDLYSFCVALHEALCGARPFVGGTFRAIHEAKLAGVVGGKVAGRRVPPRLLRAIAVGLRARPQDRYESMDALLATLERAGRRPRWPIAVAVTAVLALTAGGTLAARARHTVTSLAAAPIAAGCTSNVACVEKNGGAPFVCRASDHACVPVASEDCVAQFEPEDLASEDTVWLGALFPTKGPSAEDFGTMNMEAVDLARTEIAKATRAFVGPHAARHVPRIALVACDDSVDAKRAARHLADDVGVPAVIGFRSGQEVIDLAGSMFIGRGIVSVATLTWSPLITRLPQPAAGPRLVWRTSPNLDFVADAIARVIEDVLAPRYDGEPVRVTLVRSDVAGAVSFAERLFQTLHFNGKSAIDNAGLYTEVTVPPRELAPDELARLAARIAETSPSIVVLQGDNSIARLVEAVEARMSGARHKPTYVGAAFSPDTFASFMGSSAERRHRLYMVDAPSTSVANARFVMRYNESHEVKVTRSANGGASYEAFYLLAYGTFALEGEPVTGVRLASAFGRLIGPGRSIAIGPSGVFDALTALERGEKIDLEGTQSALDFDLRTGDESSDFALLCSDVDAAGRATGEVESGVVYEAATKRLTGTLRCP